MLVRLRQEGWFLRPDGRVEGKDVRWAKDNGFLHRFTCTGCDPTTLRDDSKGEDSERRDAEADFETVPLMVRAVPGLISIYCGPGHCQQ
jgi:hypothetical protein